MGIVGKKNNNGGVPYASSLGIEVMLDEQQVMCWASRYKDLLDYDFTAMTALIHKALLQEFLSKQTHEGLSSLFSQ